MSDDVRDDGYDDLLDAIEDGEGYYLECENGHGSLPPRRVCPHCDSRDLTEEPLPDAGRIETHTVIRVATPQFEDDAPYVTAVAEFGPVRLTGIVDADPEDVETGLPVGAGVGESVTRGERVIELQPR
ncbi:nucleic acid-binding protein [Halobacteriales archaeon QS_5_70_17]|nr:MAG: nucleic acid-binding protein [Halobacteriales archaeon QS_5_70_17]